MKRILIILIVPLFFSCDPMNGKMNFKNESDSDIYVRMIFLKDSTIIGTMAGSRNIKAHENKRIGKLYSWESEFENARNDSLSIIIHNSHDFLNNSDEQINEKKSDSLLKKGDFQYKNYSLKDLNRLKWQITYPSDGFKEGKKLKY